MSLLKELKELLTEEPWSDELPDGWKVIKDGDWTDSHKYEYKTCIVPAMSVAKAATNE